LKREKGVLNAVCIFISVLLEFDVNVERLPYIIYIYPDPLKMSIEGDCGVMKPRVH
jgi:hypothetical protein